jgi:hypothetical protein
MKHQHESAARRADLPTRGEVRGVVTVIQEDRFRLEDERGRGYLFTLGRAAGASVRDLHLWSARNVPITVQYEGPPDLGGVAVKVRPT